MRSEMIRILIVDDHFMVRMGLAGSLGEEPDFEVVGEAATGAEAMERWEALKPDVTLMDGRLPDEHGVEVIRALRETHPEARFVLVSVDETEEDIHRALEAGAAGFLPKSISRQEMIRAIRAVAGGERYLPEEMAKRLEARRDRPELTERELEVLSLVAGGMANKQIAAELNLAEVTVKVHVSRILEKLGVPDRTRASTLAIERGLVRL